MENNIQPCDLLTPCHLMEGKDCIDFGKEENEEETNRNINKAPTLSLPGYIQNTFKRCFLLLTDNWKTILAGNTLTMSSI